MPDHLQQAEPFVGYADEEQPFEGYTALMGTFGIAMSAALVAAARRNRLPAAVDWSDLAVLGFATHKLARILTKDAVTSVVRAPFVRLEEKSGSNTFEERARGRGLRRAIGELLSCPECTGQWVAGGLAAGLLHAPRATRTVAGLYTALTFGDFLQYGFAALKRRA